MWSHAVGLILFTGIRVTLVMASTGYFGDGPPMRERDFTEAISQRMRVPERLRFGPARHAHEPEDLSAAYSMHIPDRLALTGIFILLIYKSQKNHTTSP